MQGDGGDGTTVLEIRIADAIKFGAFPLRCILVVEILYESVNIFWKYVLNI